MRNQKTRSSGIAAASRKAYCDQARASAGSPQYSRSTIVSPEKTPPTRSPSASTLMLMSVEKPQSCSDSESVSRTAHVFSARSRAKLSGDTRSK